MAARMAAFGLADRPADYNRLGIAPVEIAQFEDGQRIGKESGRYEWWYFDAHLDDGATVVVVFYTKPNVSPNGPLAPRISRHQPGAIQASKSTCDTLHLSRCRYALCRVIRTREDHSA